MILDKNKKITKIEYNFLNLPKKIDFVFIDDPDKLNEGSIDFIYDAAGIKLSKRVSQKGLVDTYADKNTFYAGNYVYKGELENKELVFLSHAEGYLEPKISKPNKNGRLGGETGGGVIDPCDDPIMAAFLGLDCIGNYCQYLLDAGYTEAYYDCIANGGSGNGGTGGGTGTGNGDGDPKGGGEDTGGGGGSGGADLVYVYQYKDHLGNIRLAYSDSTGDGIITQDEIKEENNYYPFGLKHKGYNELVKGREHKFKYNGKELQDEFDLNTYDLEARSVDITTARMTSIDRFSEKYYSLSGYGFAANNPIMNVDVNGDSIIDSNMNLVKLNKDKDGNYTGKFTFTKGTSKEVQKKFMENGGAIIKEMLTIDTGKKYVTAADKSTEKILYEISDKVATSKSGGGKRGGTSDVKDSKGNILYTRVRIYEGSINNQENGTYSDSFTRMQKIAVTATHETHHGTNKDDINRRRAEGAMKKNDPQHKNAYNAGDAAEFEFKLNLVVACEALNLVVACEHWSQPGRSL